MATVANRRNASIVVHAVANTTWNLADLKVGTEATPTGIGVTQIWYGAPSNGTTYWTVTRGANTIAVLEGAGHLDFAGNGVSVNLDNAASVTVTLNGGTTGFIMLELQKLNQQYEYVQQ